MSANSRASFATPLPQSPHSDILEWRFPKPYQQYTLTGKSRAAWQTSFIIKELDLLLDAGLCVNKARPKHIFITHGHSDHTLLAPAFVKKDNPPDVFCPAEIVGLLDDFIRAKVVLNRGGVAESSLADEGEDEDEDEDEGADDADEGDHVPARTSQPAQGGATAQARTHTTHGLRPGDVVPLARLKPPLQMAATAVACAHSVPSLGYVFRVATPRLLPRYRGLSGPELRDLRRAGETVTAPETRAAPVFAFLGDGTAETLAADPEWLAAGCAVVITECSFLYPEHRAVADRTRHTIWEDLEPVVRRWPRTVFVVTHFSLRYGDDEVRRFFERVEGIGNVVVWC